MTRQLIDDCFLHDKHRLKHEEALEILRRNISPVTTRETVPLASALGRVLADDITSPRPIPGHRNAAVDGYAFAHASYDQSSGSRHLVTHRVTAGDGLLQSAEPDAAARIFTGAVMPTAYDSVVMQEDVVLENEADGPPRVAIPAGLKAGANCRQAGEDTKEGGLLASRHARLTPQHIAAIASGGIAELPVFRPLKVAILSTGNEIITPGDQFSLGKVYNSNGPMLVGLAAAHGITVTDLGIIPDKADVIATTIETAAKNQDVIISSGGASKGEEDHVITTLQALGRQHMWQLAIKPGRPMSFGQIGDTIFIGLPGNPVAAFICFLLYATPLLRRLAGEAWWQPTRFKVAADFEIKSKKPDRREFLRGSLVTRNGETVAEKFAQDGSGLIRSLTTSNTLIELPEETTSVEKGQPVTVIPFSNWGL